MNRAIAAAPEAPTMPPTAPRPIVLVVDDVPTNIRVLADALKQECRIKVASSGRDALTIVERTPPDIILLDIMMPEMDGYEVCRRLKQSAKTQHIPVIFVSARDEESDVELGFSLGAVDYITKPFKLGIVRARVLNHIRLKQQADRLESLCHIDALTEIPNRRKFDFHLESEWKRAARDGAPLSLLIFDIDHFKDFNDAYGHGTGDHCLHAVAKALSDGAMRPGDLVARYGGEEFVAILAETGAEAAAQIAERMRRAVLDLNIPHSQSSAGPMVSVSAGCATATDCARNTPARLMAAADAALYRAKSEGRNRVCVASAD